MLADNGNEVATLEERHIDVLVSVGREDRRRPHDFRPVIETRPAKELKMPWRRQMKEKMELDENRAIYALRKQTV